MLRKMVVVRKLVGAEPERKELEAASDQEVNKQLKQLLLNAVVLPFMLREADESLAGLVLLCDRNHKKGINLVIPIVPPNTEPSGVPCPIPVPVAGPVLVVGYGGSEGRISSLDDEQVVRAIQWLDLRSTQA